MADFQTHITTSTVLGIAGGLAAHAFYDVPLPSCLLAGGLCSVAGMMPDLDSDSGVPLRESVAFAAAIIPMMLVERFAKLGFTFESLVLVSALIYLVVRFGAAEFLKRYTVHRGMFHSLPAAIIASQVAFLIFDNENVALRFLNAGAVFTGYMSHLILDELWSIDLDWGLVRFKKSFGSALKFWGDGAVANLGTYATLIVLTLLMTNDPAWTNYVEPWMEGRTDVAGYTTINGERVATWRKNLFHKSYDGIPMSAYDYPWNRIPLSNQYAPSSQYYGSEFAPTNAPLTGNPYGIAPAPAYAQPPLNYGHDPSVAPLFQNTHAPNYNQPPYSQPTSTQLTTPHGSIDYGSQRPPFTQPLAQPAYVGQQYTAAPYSAPNSLLAEPYQTHTPSLETSRPTSTGVPSSLNPRNWRLQPGIQPGYDPPGTTSPLNLSTPNTTSPYSTYQAERSRANWAMSGQPTRNGVPIGIQDGRGAQFQTYPVDWSGAQNYPWQQPQQPNNFGALDRFPSLSN